MHSALMGMVLTFLAPAPLPVDKVTPSKGPPPSFAIAVVKDGKFLLSQNVPVHVQKVENVTQTVIRAGQPVTVTVPVTVVTTEQKTVMREVTGPKAFDTAGKEIDGRRLAELLRKETAVLVSGDGKPLDPFYLRTIKEGTLILALPLPPAPTAPPADTAPRPLPDRPARPR